MEITLAIKNATEGASSFMLGVAQGCVYIICASLLAVSLVSAFTGLRALILHDEPNKVEGVKDISAGKMFTIDAVLAVIAVVGFIVI